MHFGLVLDSKLDFNEHASNKINKCNKPMGILKKLCWTLSRNSLLNIYRTFNRPIFDYAAIIYDKPLTEFFKDKSEMAQYNAARLITGAVKGASRDRINREVDLESFAKRRWSRKVFLLPENNKWSFTCTYTVVYQLLWWRILDNSLQDKNIWVILYSLLY